MGECDTLRYMKHATDTLDEVVTLNEGAAILRISRTTMYRKLDPEHEYFDAELAALAHRLGARIRFFRADLLELLRSRCSSPAAGSEAAA
jgi:predicted DNA-binding transcriptional regulator AlpA